MNSSARICFIGKQMLSPPIEGHHVASKRIIEAAGRAGIQNEVVTVESNATDLTNFFGSTAVNSKVRVRGHSYFSQFTFSILDDVLTLLDVATYIKSMKYDLIHVLNINKEAYLFTHKLLRVKKPVLVHFYHSPDVLTDDVFRIRNIAMRIGLYGRILDNHVLTVNFSLSRFLVDKFSVDPERVHYAPYPTDIARFKPLKTKYGIREKHGVPLDCPIIVYVGSLIPARGVFDLVRSFRYVLTRLPRALLYICHPQRNGEENYQTNIQRLVRTYKMQKNVTIRGPNPHVEEVFNLADIVVLPFVRPYWVDPPLVLLEAMSTGASIVTTSVGSIGEIVRDHKNAVLAKPDNHLDLANKITELVENCRESRRIGEGARKTIVQNFSYEKVGERLSKIYDSVLGNSS